MAKVGINFDSLDFDTKLKIKKGKLDTEEIIKILSSVFSDSSFSQKMVDIFLTANKKNPKLSENFFGKFISILFEYHWLIDIDIQEKDDVRSYANKYMIILGKLSPSYIIVHEISHLLDAHYANQEPLYEYSAFKRSFLTNNSDAVFFLMIVKERMLSLLKSKKTYNDDVSKLNEIDLEYGTLNCICDIIDALYDGCLFDKGLTDVKNNQNNPSKVGKLSGHGVDYYKDTSNQFCEIIANYFTLSLLTPNSKFFAKLKNLLGNDFVKFLDDRCLEIVSNVGIEKSKMK